MPLYETLVRINTLVLIIDIQLHVCTCRYHYHRTVLANSARVNNTLGAWILTLVVPVAFLIHGIHITLCAMLWKRIASNNAFLSKWDFVSKSDLTNGIAIFITKDNSSLHYALIYAVRIWMWTVNTSCKRPYKSPPHTHTYMRLRVRVQAALSAKGSNSSLRETTQTTQVPLRTH